MLGLFSPLEGNSAFGTSMAQPVVIQPGFLSTNLGNHEAIRTERYQETPAHGLGYTQAYDRNFAETNGDLDPGIMWNRPVGSFPPWMPLWLEPQMIKQRKQNEYEWAFLTPQSLVEDALLYQSNLVRANHGAAYTIPTSQPHYFFKPVERQQGVN
jgi:hypothetical protein